MNVILVWRWKDAPQDYKSLSGHGGDEDWVAFIPKAVWDNEGGWIPWMTSGTGFGVCDVEEHHIETGVVTIGAHA